MTRPRCGNDPRTQLTDGDRQAIADFRAYLTRRAQEQTMTEQDYEARYEPLTPVDEARAELQRHGRGPAFVAALEAFEAAVRANERGGATRTALLTEAAEVAVRAARDCGDSETGQYAASVAAGIAKQLRRLAAEVQP